MTKVETTPKKQPSKRAAAVTNHPTNKSAGKAKADSKNQTLKDATRKRKNRPDNSYTSKPPPIDLTGDDSDTPTAIRKPMASRKVAHMKAQRPAINNANRVRRIHYSANRPSTPILTSASPFSPNATNANGNTGTTSQQVSPRDRHAKRPRCEESTDTDGGVARCGVKYYHMAPPRHSATTPRDKTGIDVAMRRGEHYDLAPPEYSTMDRWNMTMTGLPMRDVEQNHMAPLGYPARSPRNTKATGVHGPNPYFTPDGIPATKTALPTLQAHHPIHELEANSPRPTSADFNLSRSSNVDANAPRSTTPQAPLPTKTHQPPTSTEDKTSTENDPHQPPSNNTMAQPNQNIKLEDNPPQQNPFNTPTLTEKLNIAREFSTALCVPEQHAYHLLMLNGWMVDHAVLAHLSSLKEKKAEGESADAGKETGNDDRDGSENKNGNGEKNKEA